MTKFVSVPSNMSLRPVNDDDHEFLVDLHNDPFVLRNVTHPQPITMEHHLAWWRKVSHDHRQLRLIFSVDSQRVGFTKFYDIDQANNCCVVGADIHRDHRGKGLAKFMYTLMGQVCFDRLNLNRVSLTTAEFNDVGIHLYKSLGFKEEGRLTKSLFRDGKYHDQICMYMLSDDWVTA